MGNKKNRGRENRAKRADNEKRQTRRGLGALASSNPQALQFPQALNVVDNLIRARNEQVRARNEQVHHTFYKSCKLVEEKAKEDISVVFSEIARNRAKTLELLSEYFVPLLYNDNRAKLAEIYLAQRHDIVTQFLLLSTSPLEWLDLLDICIAIETSLKHEKVTEHQQPVIYYVNEEIDDKEESLPLTSIVGFGDGNEEKSETSKWTRSTLLGMKILERVETDIECNNIQEARRNLKYAFGRLVGIVKSYSGNLTQLRLLLSYMDDKWSKKSPSHVYEKIRETLTDMETSLQAIEFQSDILTSSKELVMEIKVLNLKNDELEERLKKVFKNIIEEGVEIQFVLNPPFFYELIYEENIDFISMTLSAIKKIVDESNHAHVEQMLVDATGMCEETDFVKKLRSKLNLRNPSVSLSSSSEERFSRIQKLYLYACRGDVNAVLLEIKKSDQHISENDIDVILQGFAASGFSALTKYFFEKFLPGEFRKEKIKEIAGHYACGGYDALSKYFIISRRANKVKISHAQVVKKLSELSYHKNLLWLARIVGQRGLVIEEKNETESMAVGLRVFDDESEFALYIHDETMNSIFKYPGAFYMLVSFLKKRAEKEFEYGGTDGAIAKLKFILACYSSLEKKVTINLFDDLSDIVALISKHLGWQHGLMTEAIRLFDEQCKEENDDQSDFDKDFPTEVSQISDFIDNLLENIKQLKRKSGENLFQFVLFRLKFIKIWRFLVEGLNQGYSDNSPDDKMKLLSKLREVEVELNLPFLFSYFYIEATVAEAPMVEASIAEAPMVEAPMVEAPVAAKKRQPKIITLAQKTVDRFFDKLVGLDELDATLDKEIDLFKKEFECLLSIAQSLCENFHEEIVEHFIRELPRAYSNFVKKEQTTLNHWQKLDAACQKIINESKVIPNILSRSPSPFHSEIPAVFLEETSYHKLLDIDWHTTTLMFRRLFYTELKIIQSDGNVIDAMARQLAFICYLSVLDRYIDPVRLCHCSVLENLPGNSELWQRFRIKFEAAIDEWQEKLSHDNEKQQFDKQKEEIQQCLADIFKTFHNGVVDERQKLEARKEVFASSPDSKAAILPLAAYQVSNSVDAVASPAAAAAAPAATTASPATLFYQNQAQAAHRTVSWLPMDPKDTDYFRQLKNANQNLLHISRVTKETGLAVFGENCAPDSDLALHVISHLPEVTAYCLAMIYELLKNKKPLISSGHQEVNINEKFKLLKDFRNLFIHERAFLRSTEMREFMSRATSALHMSFKRLDEKQTDDGNADVILRQFLTNLPDFSKKEAEKIKNMSVEADPLRKVQDSSLLAVASCEGDALKPVLTIIAAVNAFKLFEQEVTGEAESTLSSDLQAEIRRIRNFFAHQGTPDDSEKNLESLFEPASPSPG